LIGWDGQRPVLAHMAAMCRTSTVGDSQTPSPSIIFLCEYLNPSVDEEVHIMTKSEAYGVRMPNFTADVALHRTSAKYRQARTNSESGREGQIVPAQMTCVESGDKNWCYNRRTSYGCMFVGDTLVYCGYGKWWLL
jgi:hypothetical protein